MVSFDVGVGARCDFGSLNAFLGVPQVSHESHRDGAKAGLGVPLSKIIKESARSTEKTTPDSTLLKKKVAFRMLKQLGCEVRSNPESDISFVEVSLAKQPVLFKMLVELGHGPCRNEGEAGDLVVRVKEQRPRKPEEVVAALSAPTKPKAVPDEGYPSIGRPRLRPEDAERLVKRLYVPTKSKSAAPEKSEKDSLGAKPRRTAAEQRAYLDRLVKPREADQTADGPEEFREVAALGFGTGSSCANSLAWPKFSSPTVATAKPKPKNRRTKGPSKPLVQAGQLLLCESPVELMEESDESDREERRDDSAYVGHDSGSQFESVEPSIEPGHAEESLSPGPVSPSNSPLPSFDLAAERSEKFEDFAEEFENTEEWLNRLLGPLDMPKSKSCKPSSRLEELAKPRQLKERNEGGASAAAAPCRSPRSQREACARLSQPRKPKADTQDGTADADLPDAFPGDLDDLESDEPPVQVIPSMLAQLATSPRLERIDEETPAAGAPRVAGRNRSQKSAATPYSVPVCTLPPAPKKGASHKSQGHNKPSTGFQNDLDPELMPEELEQLASFLDEAGQSEAMLDDIDALYSQLIAGAEDAATPSTSFQAGSNSEFTQPQSNAPETPEAQKANLEGEDLLSAIDQLFHQMVPKGLEHDGMEPATEENPEIAATGPELNLKDQDPSGGLAETLASHSPVGQASQSSQALAQDGNSEMPKLLEEILWSALLLVRAGQDAAEVVSALPVSQLRDSCCLSPLPCSLQQRLAVELPHLSAALSSSGSTSSAADLLPCLRRARDDLLTFACKARSRDREPPVKIQRPPSATSPTSDVAADGKQAKRKHKVRRTSLSYWTEESLEKLEAPKAKTPKAPG